LERRNVEGLTMTQEVDRRVERNSEHRRLGSAAVALRRLSHPGRDGGVGVEGDPISQLIRRLARDMPALLEEVVSLVERRIAEARGDDGAALAMAESIAPVKREVSARFAAMARAEGMDFAEFLEHMLNDYEASRKRKADDGGDARAPRRLVLMDIVREQEERGRR
jgi:hypothetical protein